MRAGTFFVKAGADGFILYQESRLAPWYGASPPSQPLPGLTYCSSTSILRISLVRISLQMSSIKSARALAPSSPL